mgnify:CR=1 FL=1
MPKIIFTNMNGDELEKDISEVNSKEDIKKFVTEIVDKIEEEE